MPANKRQMWDVVYGTQQIPAGHKVVKVSKIKLHAPADYVDSFHSLVMSKKTDKLPKNPESDKKEPKITEKMKAETKAEKMRNAVVEREAMREKERKRVMSQQSRNDAN